MLNLQATPSVSAESKNSGSGALPGTEMDIIEILRDDHNVHSVSRRDSDVRHNIEQHVFLKWRIRSLIMEFKKGRTLMLNGPGFKENVPPPSQRGSS